MEIIKSTFMKNFQINRQAYPISSVLEKVVSGCLSILLPLMLYYVIFRGKLSDKFMVATKTNDYITYIVIGQASYSLIFSTLLNVGRSLITEIREGTIEPLIISPANKLFYFLGVYFEQFFRTIIEFFIILFIGFFFGANLTLSNIPNILFYIMLVSWSSFSVSVFLAMLMVYMRDSYLTQNTLILAIGLICGIYFPVSYLPSFLQRLSYIIPFTPLIEMFRTSIFSNTFGINLKSFFLVVFSSFLYLIIGLGSFKRIEHTIMENKFS